jgi:hypothetical protein
MDDGNRAGLILHEAAYALIEPQSAGVVNGREVLYQSSQMTRELVGYLFSSQMPIQGLAGLRRIIDDGQWPVLISTRPFAGVVRVIGPNQLTFSPVARLSQDLSPDDGSSRAGGFLRMEKTWHPPPQTPPITSTPVAIVLLPARGRMVFSRFAWWSTRAWSTRS